VEDFEADQVAGKKPTARNPVTLERVEIASDQELLEELEDTKQKSIIHHQIFARSDVQ
jgi:hypothetical protein